MDKELGGWLVSVEVEAPPGAPRLSPDDARVRALRTWLAAAYKGEVSVGERGWTATVNVADENPLHVDWQAAEVGRRYIFGCLEPVGIPEWPVIRIEAVRREVMDRERVRAGGPQLLGVQEVAKRLDVSRQRLHELRQSGRFPEPLAELAAGPIWISSVVESFIAEWNRQPGRPRQSKRFFVQHMDMNRGPNGINATAYFESFAEAQEGCDKQWSPDLTGIRQEIIEAETHERWFRAGRSDWQRLAKP